MRTTCSRGTANMPNGIVVAQVGFDRERKPGEVVERAAVRRAHAGAVERLPIVRDVLVRVPERPLQPVELQRGEFVATRGLDRLESRRRRLPWCHDYTSCDCGSAIT